MATLISKTFLGNVVDVTAQNQGSKSNNHGPTRSLRETPGYSEPTNWSE